MIKKGLIIEFKINKKTELDNPVFFELTQFIKYCPKAGGQKMFFFTLS